MNNIGNNRILKLYKDLLRYGQELTLTDKSYYYRKIREEFKKNKNLQDTSEINNKFEVSLFNATIFC